MTDRPNILVICARNKKRSRTAEYIFKNDDRFSIRSAGLSPNSEKQVSEKDVKWAHAVFVMETDHRARICALYRHLELPPIEVLSIEDEYEFLDEELIEILTEKINDALRIRYQI
jgi:protein-tyrosine phosphatase